MRRSVLSFVVLFSSCLMAQTLTPPAPQRLVVHSRVLNEDRVIWVRTPNGYPQANTLYPMVYLMDGEDQINEMGADIDFLVKNTRMPQLIVVGIAHTDRVRDLTPANVKGFPSSGGGEKFLDFIQTELMPEIESRYRVAPYRIFAGHSLGGLMAIHCLITRPQMFGAYIAASPSLQWDDGRTFHQAEKFFADHRQLDKTLYFSISIEKGDMRKNFDALQQVLTAHAPEGFTWKAETFPEEDHGSTTMRAQYDGLRAIFPDWRPPRDADGSLVGIGLRGLELHYRKLSQHYGYNIAVPEGLINSLGYQLVAAKRFDEAIAVFQRNVELYPDSSNTYDSLGEGYEGAGKFQLASENFNKAIQLARKNGDATLPQFEQHLQRVTAELKAAAAKTGAQ
jgi:predicted alpha/beta superfamily hydrolase